MSAMSSAGRQATLTESWEAPESDESAPTVRDDRVVTEAATCDCGRPAGADGLCYACRREHAGNAIGNHGGRL